MQGQCRAQQGPAGATRLTAKAGAAAPRQWALTATSSSRDVHSENEHRLLQAAKYEHRETTETARRALKVVNGMTDVAAQMLDRLYQQGQQVERAGQSIEQIEENVQHASRIITFMGRFCCFRTDKDDPDLELEKISRAEVVGRQRMVASENIAAGYAAKQELLEGVLIKKHAASSGPTADAAAAAAASNAAETASRHPWSELIAAVPGPLGRERARGRGSMPMLGHGLEECDQQQLQAETAKQDYYLDQIGGAMDVLRDIGLTMGQELGEQVPQLGALQQRAEETGHGLRSVALGAAKLLGRMPRRGSSPNSWQHGQDAGSQVMSQAMVATVPLAARYGIQ